MAEFGYHTIGANNSFDSNPVATAFTTPAAGTIDHIFVYADHSFGNFSLDAAIYGDSSGVAGARLAVSSGGSITVTSTGWQSFAISYTMASGIPLWLVCWASGGNQFMKYDTGTTGQQNQSSGFTFNTWPANLNPPTFTLSRVQSIYATYTASGGTAFTPAHLLHESGRYNLRHRQPQGREWARRDRIFIPRHLAEGEALVKAA